MSNDPPAEPRVGTRFGPYELRALVGRGGMGEVYEAYDSTKDRTVALKLLPPQFARDAEYQERFRRESQAAARLQDPHIIPIHDWGEIDGVLYIDMRLVSGHNLRDLVRSYGPMPPARAVAIVEQVASALDAAHAATLIHRDVKPENILVTRDDFAYLVDFGIAHSGYDPALTALGDAIGSYGYMAPERFDDVAITNRADVYSLACVLHEILTGEPPFAGSRPSQLIKAHTLSPPPRPSAIRAGIPAALDDVVARGMAKNPQERYVTAGDLARAAREALTAPQRDEATAIMGRALDPTRLETGDATVYRPVEGPGSERDVVARTWPPPGQSVPSVPYAPPQQYAPAPRRSYTVPILVGAIVVVALALGGIGAWLVVNESGDDSDTAAAPSPVVTAAQPATTAQPTTTTTTTTTTTAAAAARATAPPGSTPCPAVFGQTGEFTGSAAGTSGHVLPVRGEGSPGVRRERCGNVAAATGGGDESGHGTGVPQ